MIDVYSKFSDLDVDRIGNTLTVAEIKDIEEVPELETFYQEALVKHPVEVLLDSFQDSPTTAGDSSLEIDRESTEFKKSGIDELYNLLKSNILSE